MSRIQNFPIGVGGLITIETMRNQSKFASNWRIESQNADEEQNTK